jgi:hypothetical protein
MEVSEARRLRQLEEENRQLKHAVAELLLDKRAMRAAASPPADDPVRRSRWCVSFRKLVQDVAAHD